MFDDLISINVRPELFCAATSVALWTDPHISQNMLAYHLNEDVDISSYRGEFIDRSVWWLTERFELGEGRRVADLGCGPGLYTNRLARTGTTVTGVDVSAHALGYGRTVAEGEGLPVTYHQRNYLELDLPERYDLIIMIMRDYAALSIEHRATLLSVVRRHLAEGGAFVFDVDSLASFAEWTEHAQYAPAPQGGFWSASPYFEFTNRYRYEDARVSLERFEIVEEHRRRTHYNWIQYFDADSLTEELHKGGFAVESLHSDVAGAPCRADAPFLAAVARAITC